MNEIFERLLAYAQGVWRNRWYALGCAWLVCVIGWGVVLNLPDQYEATAQVFVDTQSVLRPLLKGLTVDVDPNAQVSLVARTLLSRPNLEKIIQLSGLEAQAQGKPEAMEQLINRLQKDIELTGAGRKEENLYSILFQGRDPQQAGKMVQAVVKVFEDNLNDTSPDTDAARLFLDKQIEEYDARLAVAESRLKDFKLKNAGMMPSEGQSYNARMQQTAADLDRSRLELAQAENRLNSLQQQLSGSVPQTRGDKEGERSNERIVLPIDGRIQNLEQKLDELLVQYTDKHPDVSILRRTIADLKAQREQERAQYAVNRAKVNTANEARGPRGYSFYDELKVKLAEEGANIASLQVRVTEYKRRYDELRGQVTILPKVEAELSALNRDYQINRAKYDDLLARRESARLSQEAQESKQNVRFKVIDPPRAPVKPTGPKRFLLMSLVLLIGLGSGVGLALLITQLWPVFDNRRSLMQATGIPVLGSVGIVLSVAALQQEHRRKMAYVSLSGLLVLVYGVLMLIQQAGFL